MPSAVKIIGEKRGVNMGSWLNREKITALMLEMVSVPSISGTVREQEMGSKVAAIVGRMNYFKKNPHLLFENSLQDDPYKRSYVAALVRGTGSSRRTVIFLNHYDVVDTPDYGELADLAFSPEKLSRALKERVLPSPVQRDLDSGTYLFGRGTADMKAGIALQMAVLQHVSREEDRLEGNLLFLSVPDEERASRGAMEALPFLVQLQERFHLTYEAVINCEPAFPEYPGDDSQYMYTGSMGKAIAMFYCYGKETHAGEAMSGLNGHLLAAEICRLLEGNTDFCQTAGEVVTPPPSCLKHMDFKRFYSIQVPHNAASYYNLFLVHDNPRQLLDKLTELAFKAFGNVLERLNDEAQKFSILKKTPFSPVQWLPQVYTYAEFYAGVRRHRGGMLDREIERAYENNQGLDPREAALRIVNHVHDLCREKTPKIIVGFLPPYYPSVTVEGRDLRELRALKAVEEVVKAAAGTGQDIRICPSFPGLSDLSFFNLQEGCDLTGTLIPNMPGYGRNYELPLREMARLRMPVLNMSVAGKDAHKYTERIETRYSFEALPPLIIRAVKSILA